MIVDEQQLIRLMDKLDRIAESLGEVRGQLQSSQRNFEELNNKASSITNRIGITEQSISVLISDMKVTNKRLDGIDTTITDLKASIKSVETDLKSSIKTVEGSVTKLENLHLQEQGEREGNARSLTTLEKILAFIATAATIYSVYRGH